MSAVGLESIDHTVQLTHIWINELDARLGWKNKHVLTACCGPCCRQCATGCRSTRRRVLEHSFPSSCVESITSMATATMPVKQRSKVDFIARVHSAFKADPMLITSDAVTAVFELLSAKIAAGEIEKVRHALPAGIRALWPIASQAAWAATVESS